jgi:hypothetical protein
MTFLVLVSNMQLLLQLLHLAHLLLLARGALFLLPLVVALALQNTCHHISTFQHGAERVPAGPRCRFRYGRTGRLGDAGGRDTAARGAEGVLAGALCGAEHVGVLAADGGGGGGALGRGDVRECGRVGLCEGVGEVEGAGGAGALGGSRGGGGKGVAGGGVRDFGGQLGLVCRVDEAALGEACEGGLVLGRGDDGGLDVCVRRGEMGLGERLGEVLGAGYASGVGLVRSRGECGGGVCDIGGRGLLADRERSGVGSIYWEPEGLARRPVVWE